MNVLIYLAIQFIRPGLVSLLSMNPTFVIRMGWLWQFVTYMFVHDPRSPFHLMFNMFSLYLIGRHVEHQMGSREFVLYYFVTGTLVGVFSFFFYVLTGNFWVSLMGASGALYAVMLAFAVFFPRTDVHIFGILPVRAPVMVLGFAGLSVFFMASGTGGNVAHVAHLAGFAFGWLYFIVRFGINPWQALRR